MDELSTGSRALTEAAACGTDGPTAGWARTRASVANPSIPGGFVRRNTQPQRPAQIGIHCIKAEKNLRFHDGQWAIGPRRHFCLLES